MLEVTKVDLARADVLLKSLKRCKVSDLEGEEILAFAQSWHWLVTIFDRIKEDLKASDLVAQLAALEATQKAEAEKAKIAAEAAQEALEVPPEVRSMKNLEAITARKKPRK